MMTDPSGPLIRAIRLYKSLLELVFALLPALAIAFLQLFATQTRSIEHALAHEVLTGLVILLSIFIALVSWRCYQKVREPFLRWLTLGFLGFALIYLPHGLLTRLAEHNGWLFALYGPAARLALISCLLYGLLQYNRPSDPPGDQRRFWITGLALFLGIDLLLVLLTTTSADFLPALRLVVELTTLGLTLISIGLLLSRRTSSPLMHVFLTALAIFAQASVGFMLLAQTWDYQWWLAHGIVAAGFMLLSYGVVQCYITTGSFNTVYGLEEVLHQLTQEKERAEDALARLEQVNRELQHLATVDPLTGLSNRRAFMEQARKQLERLAFSSQPACLLMIDLDHFKTINDRFGHQVGDQVLREFATRLRTSLRPEDLTGRFGGEEFIALLPGLDTPNAHTAAERVWRAISAHPFKTENGPVQVTVSVGLAWTREGEYALEQLIRQADTHLYQAKHQGRNRVYPAQAALASRH